MSLLVSAIMMQFFDAATLMYNYAYYGMAAEANPVVHGLGLDRALLFKFFMVIFIICWTGVNGVRKPRTAFILLSFFLIVGTIGTVSNMRIYL